MDKTKTGKVSILGDTYFQIGIVLILFLSVFAVYGAPFWAFLLAGMIFLAIPVTDEVVHWWRG